MSGTVSTPSSLMTNEIVDNTTGLVTPLRIRDVVETLGALPLSSATPNTGSTQTTSYTALFTDRGTMIIMNSASALNFNIPTNASVAFPVGTRIYVWQYGAGQVTIQAVTPGTTTVRNASSNTTRAQYSIVGVQKVNNDEWLLFGDVT